MDFFVGFNTVEVVRSKPTIAAHDKYECSICDSVFDSASHRPRSLPCGHGFCTQCIEACIRRGKKFCPVCKEVYFANSATSFPVNYLLEEMLSKAAISSSQNHTEDMIEMCPRHKKIPLYFFCKTHSIQVCHSCVVIDHPARSCHLIPLHEEIKKERDLEIVSIQKQKQAMIDIEKDLNLLDKQTIEFICEQESNKKDLENEVELLVTKIEKLSQEILKKEKTRKQINDAIADSQKKQKQFDLMENKLRVAIDIGDIQKQCKISVGETLQSQKWEEILRKELNVIKKNPGKYVMLKRHGSFRSCKVLSEGGKMLIPNLSRAVDPPSSANLIREAELKLRSAHTIVFMEFNVYGQNLGRVYIHVFANRPYGRQFVMLALGINGPTFKGAMFEKRSKEFVGVVNYITEDDSRSNSPLLGSLKQDYFDTPSRGLLFPYRQQEPLASFLLCIKDIETDEYDEPDEYHGCFGRVISGMEVIDRVASTEFKIRNISISECGIVLNY